MNEKEILERINSIVSKMQQSFDVMWVTDDESEQVVKVGEWTDELFELQNKLKWETQ